MENKPKKEAVIIPIGRGAEILEEQKKARQKKLIQEVLKNSKDFGKQ